MTHLQATPNLKSLTAKNAVGSFLFSLTKLNTLKQKFNSSDDTFFITSFPYKENMFRSILTNFYWFSTYLRPKNPNMLIPIEEYMLWVEKHRKSIERDFQKIINKNPKDLLNNLVELNNWLK